MQSRRRRAPSRRISGQPRGTIRVTAPLGLGRRLIASGIPEFRDRYPEIEVRLRLSDHNVDIMREGIDVGFRLGPLEDVQPQSGAGIMECERVAGGKPPPIWRDAASRHVPRSSSARAMIASCCAFPARSNISGS